MSGSKATVAIKICEPRPDLLEPANLANIQKRFGREARNGRKLVHDCVIQILDYGEHAGRPFTVLEMASSTLSEHLRSNGPMSVEASLQIIGRCLSGIGYIHGQGCIHRDIKPANILSTARGYIVADLGIVQWDDMSNAFTSAGTITNASLQLGSWYYMSPEQRSDPHAITGASDVYSLGVSWYEMLTGISLDPTTFVAKAYKPPSDNREVNELIGQMVEYEPNRRPNIGSIEHSVEYFQSVQRDS